MTNAWDTPAREGAAREFGLDLTDFQRRHDEVSEAFECGQLALEGYLDHTVFHTTRGFDRRTFVDFMKAQSQPHLEVIRVLRALRRTRRYFMATLNNESRELNQYRIESFDLRSAFDVFVSSCYVGTRKPSRGIYRLALDVSHVHPGESIFLDDRMENIEMGQDLGFGTIHVERPDAVPDALRACGIEW